MLSNLFQVHTHTHPSLHLIIPDDYPHLSSQTRAMSWLTVWPTFFMVWVAVWASIGQVRSSTFGSVTPSYTSQLTMQSTHINTNEDMQRKPLRAIYNRKENLIGRRFYLGRVNKRWGAESTHHPMTFLLDQLIILLESPTITNFDSYARPYRKNNDSTHNHVKWGCPIMVQKY